MGSITDFFFNIIPGVLLILILEKNNPGIMNQILGKPPEPELKLLSILILSMIVGFFLQAFTKLVKEKLLYQIIWCKIKNEDLKFFERAEEYLEKNNLLSKIDNPEKKIEKMFFIMDNYLSLNGGGRLLTHFASRLAYWSNLFWVSLIIIILTLLKYINDPIIITCAMLGLLVSAYVSCIHLKNQYDIILKSFLSYVVIENKPIGSKISDERKNK